MSIILFAMLGAMLDAGTAYWICFGAYVTLKLISLFLEIEEE